MSQIKSFKEIIESRLKSNKVQLPVFDKNALEIQKETSSPEPDIRKIEYLIETDPALTSQVIKMANTAFFKGLTKVATVREAIVRLGTKQVSAIVILVTQKSNFRSHDPFVHGFMAKLWRHSVGAAIGADWLANRCGYANLRSQAFVAGLLHDVGKLFLLTVVDSLRGDPTLSFKPSNTFMNEIMDTLHTEQGHRLLELWNLPESYSEIARDHHREDMVSPNSMLLLVQMADITCNKMGIGLYEPSDLILAATPTAQILGLSELDMAEMEIALEDASILSL